MSRSSDPIGAIGGAFVPITVLPAWARTIAPITPTYWVMRGMRSIILDGAGGAAILLPTIVLTIMAFAFGIVALSRLRFDETKVGFA